MKLIIFLLEVQLVLKVAHDGFEFFALRLAFDFVDKRPINDGFVGGFGRILFVQAFEGNFSERFGARFDARQRHLFDLLRHQMFELAGRGVGLLHALDFHDNLFQPLPLPELLFVQNELLIPNFLPLKVFQPNLFEELTDNITLVKSRLLKFFDKKVFNRNLMGADF